MIGKELKDFIFEKYYRQLGFTKENSYYSIKHWKEKDLLLLGVKLIKKITDASNAKDYCKSFLKNKNKKLVNQKKKKKKKNSTTKNYRKLNHYWHKISSYKTSKNFLLNYLRL